MTKENTLPDVVGHRDILNYMDKAVESGSVSHAYLLAGEKGSGKKLLAQMFAMAINCENEGEKPCGKCNSCRRAAANAHPDLIWVERDPQAKTDVIKVDEIRQKVVDDIAIRPYMAKHKIYIIDGADHMNEAAQNALLKTIEEPPAYGVIFLLAVNPEKLLPTIRSRCVTLKLRDLSDDLIKKYLMQTRGIEEERAGLCAAFAQGNMGRALELAQSEHFEEIREAAIHLMKDLHQMEMYEIVRAMKDVSKYRMEITDFLDYLSIWYRDILMFKATNDVSKVIFQDELKMIKDRAKECSYGGIEEVIAALDRAKMRLQANVNFDLTMELLLLTMKEN